MSSVTKRSRGLKYLTFQRQRHKLSAPTVGLENDIEIDLFLGLAAATHDRWALVRYQGTNTVLYSTISVADPDPEYCTCQLSV